MGPHEEGSLNIVTLLLAGRATPYLHNGVVYVGDEDHYVIEIEGEEIGGIQFSDPLSSQFLHFSRPFLNLESSNDRILD